MGRFVPEKRGDKVGSKLWLLYREKQTAAAPNRAREYARQTLQWLSDGGIVQSVNVEARMPRAGILGLEIVIEERPTGPLRFNIERAWSAIG